MPAPSQRKLEEALRCGASARPVNVDKLIVSTTHTILNYKIDFAPASVPHDAESFCGSRYTLLKPDAERKIRNGSQNKIQKAKGSYSQSAGTARNMLRKACGSNMKSKSLKVDPCGEFKQRRKRRRRRRHCAT